MLTLLITCLMSVCRFVTLPVLLSVCIYVRLSENQNSCPSKFSISSSVCLFIRLLNIFSEKWFQFQGLFCRALPHSRLSRRRDRTVGRQPSREQKPFSGNQGSSGADRRRRSQPPRGRETVQEVGGRKGRTGKRFGWSWGCIGAGALINLGLKLNVWNIEWMVTWVR